MKSHWFKFYGQDWLTDLKIIILSPVDRLCFITLLCLASTTDDAVIKNCNENALIELTHLYNNPYDDEDNDYNRAKGCLQRFNDNEMITLDNKGNITIINFLKRQGNNLTGYERVKKYREKRKNKPKKDICVINDNINDNAMITSDKIREDKIREYNTKKKTANAVYHLKEKNMDTIYLDEYGDPIMVEDGTPKKYTNKKKLYSRIAIYYMRLKGEEGNVLRYFPDIKELVEKAEKNLKTEKEIESEIKIRILTAKTYYEKNEKDWSTNAVIKNWNKIKNEIYAEVKDKISGEVEKIREGAKE